MKADGMTKALPTQKYSKFVQGSKAGGPLEAGHGPRRLRPVSDIVVSKISARTRRLIV